MIRISYVAVSATLLALAAQPCLAAEDHIERANLHRSSAAFAGVTFRVALGAAQKPSLRLQTTRIGSIMDTEHGQTHHAEWTPGLELGLDDARRPILFVGDRSLGDVNQEVNLRGETGTVLLIAGTVALIALIVVAMKGRAGTAGLG